MAHQLIPASCQRGLAALLTWALVILLPWITALVPMASGQRSSPLMALAPPASAEENPVDEPITRADLGWNIHIGAGNGWLPDWAANHAGTFVRRGDTIIFLEGINEQVWASLWHSFYFGGMAPAGLLGCAYLLMSAVGLTESASSVSLSPPLRYVSFGISLLAIINSWGWQLKNMFTNGLNAGYWNMAGNMVGGIDSHYAGLQAYQNAKRTKQAVEPDYYHNQQLWFPFWILASGLADVLYRQISGKMTDSLDITLPACLAEYTVVSIAASRTGTGKLRIHRIPRAIRNETLDATNKNCRQWRALIDLMDRDRIDALTMRASTKEGRLALHITLLDHRAHGAKNTAQLEVNTPIDGTNLVWLEQMLASGVHRKEVSNVHTLLHPDLIEGIREALDCYQLLPEHRGSLTCTGGLLYRSDTEKRRLTWVPTEHFQRAPVIWNHREADKSLLYFDSPRAVNIPYLVWQDGPQLELRDNSDEIEQPVRTYRISKQTSFALADKADYLVRYLPHGALGLLAIPALKALAPVQTLDQNSRYALGNIELTAVNYAPGWLSNLKTATDVLLGLKPTQPSFQISFSAGWRYQDSSSADSRSP